MAGANFETWGPLGARYRSEAPRRILTLDGGGIRGVLSMEVVLKLEQLLRARFNQPDLVLADYFDYIAGTSTGAIIAAALAIGMPAEEVQKLYLSVGKQVFTRQGIFSLWSSLYQGGPLEATLKSAFGAERTLLPKDLKTLLLLVTRNATTDSAWPISSNPNAKYNIEGRDYRNLLLPLWRIVRASTAAPIFFPPEIILLEGANENKEFVFVDGGTTAYNNPAFLAFKMATEPRYGLGWPRGEKNLLLVSVGTGSAASLGPTADDPNLNLISNAIHTLQSVLYQAQVDQDMSCRMIGRCTFGGHLDREVDDLIPVDSAGAKVPLDQDLGRAFLYARYDVDLTKNGLLTLGLSGIDPERVARLDAVDSIDQLRAIGQALAARVALEHFGTFA